MEAQSSTPMKKLILFLSCILLAIGACGGPMISRLYFIHGGQRIWLSSWLQTAAFPINLIPLVLSYRNRRKSQGSNATLFLMNRFLLIASALIGLLTGVVGYFSAYGSSKIPVSTTSLISACQLAFTAGFSFLLVKQKFTPYSINTVILLIIGAALLALRSSGDRPDGESSKEYVMGFIMTVLGALTYGFILPLMELSYKKSKVAISYTLLMEYQIIMCVFATVLCTVGMLINHDFQAIAREAREYELGEVKYYTILVLNAIVWQCSLLGINGVVVCGSSLLCGILIALALPVTEVLAVIFYHEKFQGEKGVSLVLSLWGFVSYFYGEIKHSKNTNQSSALVAHKKTPETDNISLVVTN